MEEGCLLTNFTSHGLLSWLTYYSSGRPAQE